MSVPNRDGRATSPTPSQIETAIERRARIELEIDIANGRAEISPAMAAQIASERRGFGNVATNPGELYGVALAAVHGAPGTQLDGQTVVQVPPLEGLRALRLLRGLVDELERDLVAKCRERNPSRRFYMHDELHSWGEISEALGVPKNTLHRRYGPGGGG